MKIVAKRMLLPCVLGLVFANVATMAETTPLAIATAQTKDMVATTANQKPETAPSGSAAGMPVINDAKVPMAADAAGPVAPASVPVAVSDPMPASAGVPEVKSAALLPATTPAPAAQNVAIGGDSRAVVSDKEIPPQVQGVVDKLRGAKIDLSLEDMNQARAALARLDLLLELERKMQDLQEARRKRDGDSAPDVSSYLPAQVLAMGRNSPKAAVTAPEPMPVSVVSKPRKPKAAPSQYEVVHIGGVAGVYRANLRSKADGRTMSVKAGEDLPDGSEVASVTATTVNLRDPEDGKIETIKIENVLALTGRRADR